MGKFQGIMICIMILHPFRLTLVLNLPITENFCIIVLALKSFD